MTEPSKEKIPAPQADVSAQRIARVYAEALLNAAESKGQADEVQEDLRGIQNDVLGQGPEFRAFFTSGTISRGRRGEALRAAFEGRANDLVTNFLLVLNEHDRLDLFPQTIASYAELLDQRRGRIPVHVQTAVPLAEDQRLALVERLRSVMRLDPVVDVSTNPDLLGGMVLRVGDWLYDASVRNRLGIIKNQLSERIKHEIQSGRDRFSSDGPDQPVS